MHDIYHVYCILSPYLINIAGQAVVQVLQALLFSFPRQSFLFWHIRIGIIIQTKVVEALGGLDGGSSWRQVAIFDVELVHMGGQMIKCPHCLFLFCHRWLLIHTLLLLSVVRRPAWRIKDLSPCSLLVFFMVYLVMMSWWSLARPGVCLCLVTHIGLYGHCSWS